MSSSIATLAIGFLAQGFFSARILVQWILSEKARRVLSPTIFWVLSLMGSYLLCIYGYLWNLKMKGVWHQLPVILRLVLLCTPLVAVAFVSEHSADFLARFLHNDEVKPWLLIFGSVGQVLFTLRFVYQWLYSRREHESRLPAGFWIISLLGSLFILTYGIIRRDPVLIVGQGFGVIAYSRNLSLIMNENKQHNL